MQHYFLFVVFPPAIFAFHDTLVAILLFSTRLDKFVYLMIKQSESQNAELTNYRNSSGTLSCADDNTAKTPEGLRSVYDFIS